MVPVDGVVAIAFPFIAATAGWILTEMGRQPWIVQDLLKTSDAHSPSVSTATIASEHRRVRRCSTSCWASSTSSSCAAMPASTRRALREETAAAVPALSY